jgi:hypothetical protein
MTFDEFYNSDEAMFYKALMSRTDLWHLWRIILSGITDKSQETGDSF